MEQRGVDALVVTTGSDLPYLIGYKAMENERITALVIAADGDPTLVVPVLEEPRIESTVATRAWGETEDPITIIAGLANSPGNVAIGNQTWSTFLLGLQEQLPSARFQPAEPLMSELRMVKDPGEIDALRAAGAAVDGVVGELASTTFSGQTERELSRHVDEMTIDSGHQRVGFAIVASGPNGASPHHEPGDRLIELDEADAQRYAANSFTYAPDDEDPLLFMPGGISERLQAHVRDLGVTPTLVDVSEFLKKGGGSVKCMIGDLGLIESDR